MPLLNCNEDEDKAKNIDSSVNSEVGDDSSGDNRVIRDRCWGQKWRQVLTNLQTPLQCTHIIHSSNICFQTQFIFLRPVLAAFG